MTPSTTPAGVISQIARGGMSAATSSGSAVAPSAWAPASSWIRRRVRVTTSALRSVTTSWWPARARRTTMFCPMRPKPIIPSCTAGSFLAYPWRAATLDERVSTGEA